MWQNPSEQLESIHAMLATGHRSVRLEGHTLVLWGLTAALLIVALPEIFSPDRFPVHWQRTLAANAAAGLILLAVGIWDYRLTRRARAERDETLSFVQRQVLKVWWLMVGLILLLNVGMNFFGGGYLFYAIVMALMGIAFYVHGLFSTQMLSWVGLSMVGLGLASIALQIPFALLEWLTVSVFGIGLPLLALGLRWEAPERSAWRRLALSAAWLAIVVAAARAFYALDWRQAPPELRVVSLADYRAAGSKPNALPDPVIVHLAPGTDVPLDLRISGDALDTAQTTIPLRLSRALDLVVRDGKPTGQYRLGKGPWHGPRRPYRVSHFHLSTHVPPGQVPAVSLRVRIVPAR